MLVLVQLSLVEVFAVHIVSYELDHRNNYNLLMNYTPHYLVHRILLDMATQHKDRLNWLDILLLDKEMEV